MSGHNINDPAYSAAYAEAMRDPAVQAIFKRHGSPNAALQDPDLAIAFDAAFEAAHNAAMIDPFEHERREAARLREKVQAAYAAPGLAWHYHGENSPALVKGFRWINGLGYWTGGEKEPRDIATVSMLLDTLEGIDRGPTQSGRMLMAKRLITLLRLAQKACGDAPQPRTFALLTERQKEVISILRRGGVKTIHDAVKREFIVERVINPHPDKLRHKDDVKHDLKKLRDLNLVDTKGERAAMVYWLSREGAALGEYLHNNA